MNEKEYPEFTTAPENWPVHPDLMYGEPAVVCGGWVLHEISPTVRTLRCCMQIFDCTTPEVLLAVVTAHAATVKHVDPIPVNGDEWE